MMGKVVSVSVDDDIYAQIEAIKEASGISASQAANRLMRAGINYMYLGKEIGAVGNDVSYNTQLLIGLIKEMEFNHLIED